MRPLIMRHVRCLLPPYRVWCGHQSFCTSVVMGSEKKHAKLSEVVKQRTETALQKQKDADVDEKVTRELAALGQKLSLTETSVDRYRVDMLPVCKEILLGKLDTRLFSYPDVLENDRFLALEKRVQDLYNFLRSKKPTFDSKIDLDASKDAIWQKLIKEPHNLQGLRGPLSLGGQELCITETTRILEELGEDLSLATTVSHPNQMAIAALQMMDDKDLRDRYLTDLHKGNKIAAVCWADDNCGSDILSTTTKAEIEHPEDSKEPPFFKLNGTKTWVSNGSKADLYIVFAMARVRNEFSSQVPQATAFVVERNSKGVSVNPRAKDTQKATLKNLDLAEVRFENVHVPSSNVIGTLGGGSFVYQAMIAEDKCLSAAQMFVSLKKLFNLTVKHVSQRQAYNNKLSYYPLVKFKLGECAMYLYALHSVVYMTTGLADVQKEVDVDVEAAVTKLFALKCSRLVTDHCTSLLGRVGLDPENVALQTILRDIKAFAHWPVAEDILSLFASTACMEYAGLAMHEELELNRRPTLHPFYSLTKQWHYYRAMKRKNPSMLAGLDDHVHPALVDLARILERELMMFPFVVEALFAREGKNLQSSELELVRITRAVMMTYVSVCILGHANRSLCRGHPMMMHQIDMADAFVRMTMPVVRENLEKIAEGSLCERPDSFVEDVGNTVIEEGGYCASHPVTRNIW